MQNRDVWKMLHLLYRQGENGLSLRALEGAGFGCGPDAVRNLADGEAIVASGPADPEQRFRLSKAANHILAACIVAHAGPRGTLVQVDRPSAFVIMPFSEDWSTPVFRWLIRPSLEDEGIQCVRGDTALRIGELSTNVWGEILRAGFVVADLSARNPNVYFEFGLAHALGKDCFLLKRRGVKLPADFGGAHFIEYDLKSWPKARQALRTQIRDWKLRYQPDNVERLYEATPAP
jgi:hypothetical protein